MSDVSEELQLRLAAIVETSDDAIISKDLQGIVKSWNLSAERIFGYTAAEMVGQSIGKIIPADRKQEEPVILERIRRGERVDHFQTVRQRKDGSLLDISVTISPIKDGRGEIVGASKIARDITDYLRLQQERDEVLSAERAARSEAERVSRMKDEFIATLSHELRTPLNAILGWSQLLCQTPPDAETLREGMAVIERNAKAQTQLIEDLLDMGRIMSGKIRLDVQRVDLVTVIEAALESIQPTAGVKGVVLVKVLDPGAGPVAGDPNRLQQGVWNLLTNAIKFTPAKGRVEVLLERVNSHVEITVSDTGKGIKPEFLPFVFDRFRQADSSITREHGGLGLGLAIVKHLVELHNGKIRVKSAGEGRGASFSIELPLAPIKHEEGREKGEHKAHPFHKVAEQVSLKGVKVLVLDDEPDARDLIRRLLEDCGAEVYATSSVDQAFEALRSRGGHIVISDIGMPHKDGYEFIRLVRSLPAEKGGKIPAIALTAFARPADRTRALLAGYQVHVVKPVDAQELVATVASLLGRTG